jgi:hypothetical protein
MSKPNRKLLNRLIATLAALVTAATEQTARRNRAQLLRAARALRTVKPGRPVVMTQAEIALARTAPIGRHVVATAYGESLGSDVTAELQAKWDEFRSWQGDAGFGELGERFKGGLLNLKRRIWKLHSNGDSVNKISRDLWYEFSGYRMFGSPDAPNIRLLVPPEFVESVVDEATGRIGQPDGTVISAF